MTTSLAVFDNSNPYWRCRRNDWRQQ